MAETHHQWQNWTECLINLGEEFDTGRSQQVPIGTLMDMILSWHTITPAILGWPFAIAVPVHRGLLIYSLTYQN
ncbi:conserved hypothetical protein [Ricinus communis]|uniref:Uncharacterized protein n=1 Tax=Ricinus communis TaxID=3988 RepID=B9R815_RICCO|nr:conserved hypothetical protein [Ricinus communis]